MSDLHEQTIASDFGVAVNPGSGNQFANPGDGRSDQKTTRFAFCWDGKSTLGNSISVTRSMWAKIKEQSRREQPMIQLCFYDTDRLDSGLYLVVTERQDFMDMWHVANGHS
jgi:hypothetical protein